MTQAYIHVCTCIYMYMYRDVHYTSACVYMHVHCTCTCVYFCKTVHEAQRPYPSHKVFAIGKCSSVRIQYKVICTNVRSTPHSIFTTRTVNVLINLYCPAFVWRLNDHRVWPHLSYNLNIVCTPSELIHCSTHVYTHVYTWIQVAHCTSPFAGAQVCSG